MNGGISDHRPGGCDLEVQIASWNGAISADLPKWHSSISCWEKICGQSIASTSYTALHLRISMEAFPPTMTTMTLNVNIEGILLFPPLTAQS